MPSSDYIITPYDPCPCNSGKKYKFCCGARAALRPVMGTIAYYGPDRKTIEKIVAGAVPEKEDAETVLQKWFGANVATDPLVTAEIRQFFARHHVKRIVINERVMGCIHEEGIDFPAGQDCPHCPFWAGKQGAARRLPTSGI